MKLIKISFLILSIMLVTVISCDDDILDKVNPNQLSSASFFRNADQAVAAINAVYAGLQGTNMYTREYFFLHDLLSDDVQAGGAQLEAPRAQVLNHVFDGANTVIGAVWQGLYRLVLRSNFVINNIQEATGVSAALKNRIEGEARFLRAWTYFELVSLWGRVPLMTEVATSVEGTSRASSEDEVYALIFSDLEFAINNLPVKSAYSGSDVGRASKGAAQTLAAKAHLFRGNYAAAEPFLQAVISSNEYSLVDRFLDNHQEDNENNEESIFEVQFSRTFGNGGGWNGDGGGIAEITFRGQEYAPNSWRNLIPSDGLVAEFEDNDPRDIYTFYRVGDPINSGAAVLEASKIQGDANRPSWKKYQMIYKVADEASSSGINFRVMRYADVLLMMAEVKNELSGPAAALPFINQVRARADVNMPPYPTAEYPANTKDEMFRAIVHERRVELSGEQVRNRDLRRWRRLGKLSSEPIAGFENKHNYLPLPLVEIDNNSALSNEDQNPGY